MCKTSLVAAALADVPPGINVLRAGCDALSTPRPLGPVRDLVVELGDEVGARSSVVHRPSRSSPRCSGGYARRRPSWSWSDVHWADEATLDLLRYLGRRIMTTRSVLVLTYRDVEVGVADELQAVLGDLVRVPSIERISLVPLSVDGMVELLEGLTLDAEKVHAKTGGKPFFVTEVVADAGARRSGLPVSSWDARFASRELRSSSFSTLRAASRSCRPA